jgi:hypothetical protein
VIEKEGHLLALFLGGTDRGANGHFRIPRGRVRHGIELA